ncbi:hypothetical protein Cgig2_025231 [Carnegiea gigantea]|uniref:Uncharacterized protein n=1 Tax=Carnegiea gigantea TaxID=171969 RepID=A0A9Q1KTE5_9CARY|nr:hypothetical protein Cgig2_025231 [Carnegiea gigantea]
MSKLRAYSRTNKQTILTNEHENEKISRIRENKLKLQSLGIKRIATSLTSLVDDTNAKRAKGKQKSQMDNDVDYVLCYNNADEEQDHGSTLLKKSRSSTKVKGLEMKQAIAPMSIVNFLLMSKKQQRAVVGDEALKKVAAAFKAVEQESNDEVFAENIYADTHRVLNEQQYSDDDYDHINFEIEGVDQENGTRLIMDDQNMSSRDQVGGNEETRPINPKSGARHNMDDENLSSGNQVGGNEETRPINPESGTRHIMDDENLSSRNQMGGNEETRPINPGTVKKTRGIVYCRKLTTLPPGEKLTMEFHNDGIPVGANGSSFSFFLGNQVKNRTVIPIQKEKYGRECARLDLMLKFHRRTSDKLVNAENLTNNMPTKAAMEKLKNEREQGLNDKTDEQIFQEIPGKDKHGYLHAYGSDKSITDYFGVKPSHLDLAQHVMELNKRADESVVESKKDVEEARKEAEQAKLKRNKPRKKQKKLGKKPRQQDKRWTPKLKQTIRCGEKR